MMDFEAASRIQRLRGELLSAKSQASQAAERMRELERALEQARDETAQARAAADKAGATLKQAKAEADELRKQLEDARKQAAEAEDQRLRGQADAENYKKRIERTQTELARSGRKALLTKALLVLDNLARAMEYEHAAVTDPAGLVAGLRLTYWQLNDLLTAEGLKPIESMGAVFDPRVHEAVDIDTSGKAEPGIITEELQKGFYYGGEVLRPAKVKVAGAVPRRQLPTERAG